MPSFDLKCNECGQLEKGFIKGMRDPFPDCSVCGAVMQRDWKSMGAPGISWKGPGGSPLKGGSPSKPSFNMNEQEVEQELFQSITEEE